jgi:polyphosphate kinase 2 (PPK2 family)
MVARTSTEYAPWHIVSAEDKNHARLRVLTIIRDAMKEALECRDSQGEQSAEE